MTTPPGPAAADTRLETLLAATIFLMSAHAREGGGTHLAGVVLRHLEAIADRCDARGVLAATCEQAADHWAQLAGAAPAEAPAAPLRRGRLRLVRG